MKENSCPSENREIRALIISDRLLDEAKVLAGYLQCTGVVDVVGIAGNRQQALAIAQEAAFDYLIIAGYLRSEHNYGVIAELQRQQMEFQTVHWAMLDPLIAAFCSRYEIPLQFERTLPLEDFVRFLDAHHNSK
jgi:hypothetical protein